MFLKKSLLLIAALGSVAWGSAWSATPAEDRSALEKRARQNAGNFYDEIFDGQGKIRPQYEDLWAIYSRLDRSVLEKFRTQSDLDFQKDNALSAMPKVLTENEYGELRKGVEQRAKAALLFLQDHYSGTRSYLSQNIIPADVIAAIMERSGETTHLNALKEIADGMSFPYGSDLIRAADGKFYEIEFNSGFVGGFGDIRLARRILFERIPEYSKLLGDTPEPQDFYRNLLARYRAQLKDPNDLVVFLTVPPYADKEDNRLIKIWKDLGVHHIDANDKQKLINEADATYVETTTQKAKALGWEPSQYTVNDNGTVRRRIGVAIVNSEFSWADNTHALTAERYWVETANYALESWDLSTEQQSAVKKALVPNAEGKINVQKIITALNPESHIKDAGFPGLIDAILTKKIVSNYTPGTELLSDKEFHIYFEDLIRFYLHEEPIIPNLPTQRFYTTTKDGQKILNKNLLDDTMANLDKYVVKVVDGRGGVGVWVGSKVPENKKAELAQLIAAEPERYIRQRFMHLSTMDRDITDIRMLAQVGPLAGSKNLVEVSSVPWGRALPIDGNGKVNLSGDGHEVSVFVRKDGSYPKRPAIKSLLERPCPILFQESLSLSY